MTTTPKASREKKPLAPRTCENPACGKRFTPIKKNQRACSPDCRHAKFAAKRVRVWLTPRQVRILKDAGAL